MSVDQEVDAYLTGLNKSTIVKRLKYEDYVQDEATIKVNKDFQTVSRDLTDLEEIRKTYLGSADFGLSFESLKQFASHHVDIMEYEGLDTDFMRSLILKKFKIASIDPVSATRFLCMVIHCRGTSLEKIRARSSDLLVSELNKYISILNIRKNLGPGMKRDYITLARLPACFPGLMVKLSAILPSRIVEVNWIPNALKSNYFSAVCPSNAAGLILARINLYYLQLFSKVIKQKEDPISTIIVFWRAGFKSKLMSNSMRVTFCKEIGLMETKLLSNLEVKVEKLPVEIKNCEIF